MHMKPNSIASLLLGTALTLAVAGAAMADDKVVKIGVLTDNSGLYADLGGAGSTLAAQMAIEDSGMAAKGWIGRRLATLRRRMPARPRNE